MKNPNKPGSPHPIELHAALTLGEYAHAVIRKQYWTISELEKNVLADKDPEYLHRMRVGTRRLRTALQVFGDAIQLPKAAQEKQVGAIAKVLGNLRDLDVQIADLQTHYRPNLEAKEQGQIDHVIKILHKQRRHAFSDVESILTQTRYQELKAVYETWLEQPHYTAIASQLILRLLADLLSPLLSTLLLHPGWLTVATDTSNPVLHDLRKACKHARYQAEFFAPFYGDAMQEWLEEVKQIQAKLGKVHDGQVLLQLMETHLPKHAKIPHLRRAIQQTQTEEMQDWESLRQKYLDPDYRRHLHYMILQPTPPSAIRQLVSTGGNH